MENNTLTVGGSYDARRNKPIAVQETERGALMVYISYAIEEPAFEGVHGVCIGSADGALQERNIQTLRDVFGWKSADLKELQELPLNADEAPEFRLVDWHNEPYVPKNGTKEVDRYCFRWLNELGRGVVAPATDEALAKITEKWGKKLATTLPAEADPNEVKTTAKPAVEQPTAAKRGRPARSSAAEAKPARLITPEGDDTVSDAVFTLLANKKFGNRELTDSEMKACGDEFYNACDALFGKGKTPETPEQGGQLADKLGC